LLLFTSAHVAKDWIPEEDAVKIENELQMNKKVLNVSLDSLGG